MTTPGQVSELEFEGFRLDLARRVLAGPDGAPIELKPKVFDTLAALAARPGQLVTKAELLETVWPDVVVEENNLNQAISALRKVLGDADGKRLIVTVPGRGYQLAAQPTDGTPPERRATAPGVGPTRRVWGIAAVAAFALLMLAAAGWGLLGRRAGAPVQPSVAILAFANLTSEPDKDYIGRGVATEVIERLSQLDGVRVIAPNSSFTFDPQADPRTVGRDLGVTHVLSGTVTEKDGRIRISASLADAKTGEAIWTRPFERELAPEEPYVVQRLIAEQVAGAMSIAFKVDAHGRLAGSGTRNMEAYDLYLRGMDQWWYQGDRELAIASFSRAVELDPRYADAWAGNAIATASTWNDYPPAESRRRQDAAYAMAKRAVELNPDLSLAQAVFGALATTQARWDEADAATGRALEISRTEMALNNRQMFLLRTGRLDQAHDLMQELARTNPLRTADAIANITTLSALGRHADVARRLASMHRSESLSFRQQSQMLMAEINAGAAPASVRRALEAISLRTEKAPADFARSILDVFDDPEKARGRLRAYYDDQTFEHPAKWELIPFLAAWYGDTDLVLKIWQDELPTHSVRTAYMWGPAFAEARGRPEFEQLMQKIGLADHWRAHGWPDKCRPAGVTGFDCD